MDVAVVEVLPGQSDHGKLELGVVEGGVDYAGGEAGVEDGEIEVFHFETRRESEFSRFEYMVPIPLGIVVSALGKVRVEFDKAAIGVSDGVEVGQTPSA